MQCLVELEALEIPPFTGNVGAQQGQGSSPSLSVNLVERLRWFQWGAAAAEHAWGAEVECTGPLGSVWPTTASLRHRVL